MSAPKVVLIDNYDSFTFNLVQRLGELGAEVEVGPFAVIGDEDDQRLLPKAELCQRLPEDTHEAIDIGDLCIVAIVVRLVHIEEVHEREYGLILVIEQPLAGGADDECSVAPVFSGVGAAGRDAEEHGAGHG